MITYVVPLRCVSCTPDEHAGLAGYLGRIAWWADVIVVDGSDAAVSHRHRDTFRGVGYRRVDPDLHTANGKVAGVLTGIRHAGTERIVIADDDVRYEPAELMAVAGALDDADLVVPQNVFRAERLPWHARWDLARSLLNRAFGTDYPGTVGVRRSIMQRTRGYDGDVLFENLELMRTVTAAGGTVRKRPDLAVGREPASTKRFWEQRVRQAYDDFAQPPRLVGSLAVVPALVWALARRRSGWLVALAATPVAVAAVGRARHGGASMFPATTVLFAPAWVLERAVCSWLALSERLVWGGCRYRATTIRRAATPMRELRRRHASRRTMASIATDRTGTAARWPVARGWARRPLRSARPVRARDRARPDTRRSTASAPRIVPTRAR